MYAFSISGTIYPFKRGNIDEFDVLDFRTFHCLKMPRLVYIRKPTGFLQWVESVALLAMNSLSAVQPSSSIKNSHSKTSQQYLTQQCSFTVGDAV